MDKFSLYDFLGLVLPGALFIFLIQTISFQFEFLNCIFPVLRPEILLLLFLCISIMAGAILFVLNFHLVNKMKLYHRITGMYKHVADIYFNLGFMHKIMNESFNTKTQEWLNHDAYFSKSDYNSKSDDEKKLIKEMQDEAYDRMYYELEYKNVDSSVKTPQSFYFFFRQSALAFIFLIIYLIILFLLSILDTPTIKMPELSNIILLLIVLVIGYSSSVLLAIWFRKRMVLKLYWTYFTHLNLSNS